MICPVEALEQARELLLVNADAVVGSAQHDIVALALDGQRERGAGTRVADRVLRKVLADHPQHPRSHLQLDSLVAFDGDRHTGSRRALLELGHGEVELRPDGDGAERDNATARLELRKEEHLVDQLARRLDLAAGAVDERVHVLAGQRRSLEQRQQARERRAQLVRHSRGEPCPQLLVRGHITSLTEVDDPLSPAARVVRHDQRHESQPTREKAVGNPFALVDPVDRLPCPPAREHNCVGVIEDDHRLAALLDHCPTSSRVRVHLHIVLTEYSSRTARTPTRTSRPNTIAGASTRQSRSSRAHHSVTIR